MTFPIVLIHGLWLTPRSWEGWKARFEQRGHEVLAPAWPRMEGEVEALRSDPSVMDGLGSPRSWTTTTGSSAASIPRR